MTNILNKDKIKEEMVLILAQNTKANQILIKKALGPSTEELSPKAQKYQDFIYSDEDPFGCHRDAVAGIESIRLGEDIIKMGYDDKEHLLRDIEFKYPFVFMDGDEDPSAAYAHNSGYFYESIEKENVLAYNVGSETTNIAKANYQRLLDLKDEGINKISENIVRLLSTDQLYLFVSRIEQFEITLEVQRKKTS